jgi:hypothetical protein
MAIPFLRAIESGHRDDIGDVFTLQKYQPNFLRVYWHIQFASYLAGCIAFIKGFTQTENHSKTSGA